MFTVLLSILACTSDKGDSGLSDPSTFEGGSFQFTSIAVNDQCLDGAFDVLFLPDGNSSDWQYPIELPSWDDMPQSYSISLQDPFTDMAITANQGPNETISISDGTQTGILFNANAYPDCLVDLGVNAAISLIDGQSVSGIATLTVTNAIGDTCPLFASDPCTVLLDFQGVRLQ